MRRPPVLARAIERGMAPFRGGRAARLLPRTPLGGPMPWVIAIMVGLSVLAAGGALAMQNVTETARSQLSEGVTIQIVEADEAKRQRQAEEVLAAVQTDPGVVDAFIVPPEDVAALVEPWLGQVARSDVVPLPALIDMTLAREATPDLLAALEEQVGSVAPGARIDAQSDWLGPVFEALDALRYLAWGLIGLLILTSAAAVWLAARNALNANGDTIEVVHLLGGTDDQIVRIFQRSVLIDAGVGSAIGVTLGVLALLLLGTRFAALDTGLTSMGGLATIDWALLLLVPLFAVATALITARATVMASLRQIL